LAENAHSKTPAVTEPDGESSKAALTAAYKHENENNLNTTIHTNKADTH